MGIAGESEQKQKFYFGKGIKIAWIVYVCVGLSQWSIPEVNLFIDSCIENWDSETFSSVDPLLSGYRICCDETLRVHRSSTVSKLWRTRKASFPTLERLFNLPWSDLNWIRDSHNSLLSARSLSLPSSWLDKHTQFYICQIIIRCVRDDDDLPGSDFFAADAAAIEPRRLRDRGKNKIRISFLRTRREFLVWFESP